MTNQHALGAAPAPKWHRPFLRYLEGENGPAAPAENAPTPTPSPAPTPAPTPEPTPKPGSSFTQADVDRIVRERLEQQARSKFGDYEQLKAAAEGAQTVEQKLAELEKKHADAEARALRSDIAAKHGISPEDRDLFLTGSDEATLTAQAQRLAARDAEKKTKGNVAPKEGTPANEAKDDTGLRELTRGLFGRSE